MFSHVERHLRATPDPVPSNRMRVVSVYIYLRTSSNEDEAQLCNICGPTVIELGSMAWPPGQWPLNAHRATSHSVICQTLSKTRAGQKAKMKRRKNNKAGSIESGRVQKSTTEAYCTHWPRVISGKPRLHCSCAAGEMPDLTARDLLAVASREGHTQGLPDKTNRAQCVPLVEAIPLPLGFEGRESPLA